MAEFAPTVQRLEKTVFIVTAFDCEDTGERRDEFLEGHLEYVEKHSEEYLVSGPLRKPGETELCGSFFMVAADDAAHADRIVRGDPYFACGLYGRIEKREFTAAAGKWMGGVIWESAAQIRAATEAANG